jgi:hypothetical protein
MAEARTGVDGRCWRCSGTRGSAVTYAGRWRRGERGRLSMKTRRHGAHTRAEAVKHGRATTGRGALGHGRLRTRPVGTAARRARCRTGLSGRRGSDTGDTMARLGHVHSTVGTTPLRHGRGRVAPRGDSLLISGPGVERDRLTGGTRSSDFLN